MGIFDGSHGQRVVGCHHSVKGKAGIGKGKQKLLGSLKVLGTLMNKLRMGKNPGILQCIFIALHLVDPTVGMAGVQI